MQDEPRYDDVVAEVADFLVRRAEAAMAAGVAREKIWLDPGIGFGKHMIRHNLPLLAGLERIVALGFPVLLGASRKGLHRGPRRRGWRRPAPRRLDRRGVARRAGRASPPCGSTTCARRPRR
jgi:hypothetical protein